MSYSNGGEETVKISDFFLSYPNPWKKLKKEVAWTLFHCPGHHDGGCANIDFCICYIFADKHAMDISNWQVTLWGAEQEEEAWTVN